MSHDGAVGAAVVGTGFIGVVHVDALRRIGVEVRGVAHGRPAAEPSYPTLRDGHVQNVLCDAVALSNRERRWVEVPVS